MHIEGLWQGSFNQLQIIGDKSGGRTSENLKSFKGMACLKQMIDTLNNSVIAIHVVRNPYDMIATQIQWSMLHGNLKDRSVLHTQPNSSVQIGKANEVFGFASAILSIIQSRKINVVEIHSEDYIKDPWMSLSKLCSGLGVACSENYIEQCYKKAYRKVSRSRDYIEWDPTVLEYIRETMTKFPFFHGYTFEDDYYNS